MNGNMTAGIIKLTEQQFYAFVEDRLDGSGPCRVQEDLAFAVLANTSVVPNARLFMMALDDSGAKLTAAENLNRKFVGLLLDRLQWQGCDAVEIRSVCKTGQRTRLCSRNVSTRHVQACGAGA